MSWAEDYREVAERIGEWYDKNPEGRIVCEVIEFSDARVTVKASAYRDGGSEPAGVGHSFLSIPGKTSFTKGSELENAETSAAGRALVMAGIRAKTVSSESERQSKESPDVEPAADGPEGQRSHTAGGKADGDGGPRMGKARPSATSGGSEAPPDGEGRDRSGPPALSPEEEQQNAYIDVLRSGPGNTQSVLMARKLYETQVRKIRHLRDLDLNELHGVIQAFKEKVEA